MKLKLLLIFCFFYKFYSSQNFKARTINGNIIHSGILPFGQGLLGDRMIFSPPESIPNANGKYIAYFREDTSTIAWEGYYKNSKRDSIWIEYWPQGQVFANYTYKHGKLNGKVIRKLRNGFDWHVHFYKDGLADSTWIWYDPNLYQSPKRIEHYKNGKQNGELAFYENGYISSKWNVCDGKVCNKDTMFTYYPNGKKLSEIIYRNDSMIMINHWDQYNKQVIKNGTGHYRSLPDKNGRYEIGDYKNGLKDGQWQLFDTKGNPYGKVIRTTLYKNGTKLSPDPIEEGN